MPSLPIVSQLQTAPILPEPLAGMFMTYSLAIEALSPQEQCGVLACGWQAREKGSGRIGSEGGRRDRRLFPHSRRVSEGR